MPYKADIDSMHGHTYERGHAASISPASKVGRGVKQNDRGRHCITVDFVEKGATVANKAFVKLVGSKSDGFRVASISLEQKTYDETGR